MVLYPWMYLLLAIGFGVLAVMTTFAPLILVGLAGCICCLIMAKSAHKFYKGRK